MAKDGVPVASVGDLSTYGLLTDIEENRPENQALDLFGRMYAPAIGRGAVTDYIRRTGVEAMAGADILGTAPGKYTSTIEYGNSDVGRYLRDMSRCTTPSSAPGPSSPARPTISSTPMPTRPSATPTCCWTSLPTWTASWPT